MNDDMTAEAQEDYSQWLTQELNSQRADKKLCDVVLKCGTREFPAHRNVLCAASSYFNSLLDGGFTESAQQVIDVTKSFPNPDILEPVLKYLYTGQMDIEHVDYNNRGDLLDAVSFMLLDRAGNIVVEALTDSLMFNNCVKTFTLASKSGNVEHLAELSARIIESRVPDLLHHGEELYDLEPELLLNLLCRARSGFQHLSDEDAICFLKKYTKEWLSKYEGDNQLLVSLKNVVTQLCPLFVNRDDVKARRFWIDLLQMFNDEKDEERPAKFRRKLKTVLSLEDTEISDAAKFGRTPDEPNDILVLRTEKKGDDGNEPRWPYEREPTLETLYALDTVTARWVKITEHEQRPFYTVLGICNGFLIMGHSNAKMSDLLAISLSGGKDKEIKSAHVWCVETDNELERGRGVSCRAHLFVTEKSIFCIDPVPCCYADNHDDDSYDGEEDFPQTIGYVLKKYNWNSSKWETCADILIPQSFDLNRQVLDRLHLQHRDMRTLVSIHFMTAVKGSEIVIFAYKSKNNDELLTHFSVTMMKMNPTTGTYNLTTVGIGMLGWGGFDMENVEPSELNLLPCDQESQVKLVLLTEKYVVSWTIETKEISESEMSSVPRNLIRPRVARITRPRCYVGMGLPLREIRMKKQRKEYSERKFRRAYRLSSHTGLVYCVETYHPYINLTWRCNVEKNKKVQTWNELPPPPTDEKIDGFEVIGAPKYIAQKLLGLPRARFGDPYVNEDMGPYNHTKYEKFP